MAKKKKDKPSINNFCNHPGLIDLPLEKYIKAIRKIFKLHGGRIR